MVRAPKAIAAMLQVIITAATFGLHSKVGAAAIKEVIKTVSPCIYGVIVLAALSLKPFTCRQKLQQ
jgi:hypothetical protein